MITERIGTVNQLSEFLMQEMRRRDMSMRKFAEFLGVTHATMSNLLAENRNYEPSVSTLALFAKALRVDICTLVAMLAPDATMRDAQAELLATYIGRLPEEQRRIVDAYLLGLSVKNEKKAK